MNELASRPLLSATLLRPTASVWSLSALAMLDCGIRLAILGFWLLAPERVPDVPAFYKGVRFPEVQAGIVAVVLPALVFIAWAPLRSPCRWRWLAIGLMAFGIVLFVLALCLSFNVVGTGALYCALGGALAHNVASALRQGADRRPA